MSLEKAIQHKKEKRKPYKDSRRFDRSCRNHGNCGWCENQRTFTNKRKCFVAQAQIDETNYETGKEYENAFDFDLEKEIFGEK
jgi:hypothetical protein